MHIDAVEIGETYEITGYNDGEEDGNNEGVGSLRHGEMF